MPDPVYSQADTVVPVGSDMGPVALGPVAPSPRAAAASSFVRSEQASPGAGNLAAVAVTMRVATIAAPAERTDRDMIILRRMSLSPLDITTDRSSWPPHRLGSHVNFAATDFKSAVMDIKS